MGTDFRCRHSLSAGTASANLGVVSLCAKVDLRTRAISAGLGTTSLNPHRTKKMQSIFEESRVFLAFNSEHAHFRGVSCLPLQSAKMCIRAILISLYTKLGYIFGNHSLIPQGSQSFSAARSSERADAPCENEETVDSYDPESV